MICTLKTLGYTATSFTVLFIIGCVGNPLGISNDYTRINDDPNKPFDAAPTEGWATDPNLSYRLYSYYPVNLNPGSFSLTYPGAFPRI